MSPTQHEIYNQTKNLYKQAKESYYVGKPTMSDFEFDELENTLKLMTTNLNLEFEQIVGFNYSDRNKKFTHPSRMGSLAKIQSIIDAPINEFKNWSSKIVDSQYEATPKFDGNALNTVYRNGKLEAVLSRGNGTAGRDYADKLINILPKTINTTHKLVEIRGEVVISTKIFDKKYSEYKNERNFVAGILNRDEDVTAITQDFAFLPVEIRVHRETAGSYEFLDVESFVRDNPGFKKPFEIKFKAMDFETVYNKMLNYRMEMCEYRLDGFVIKTSPEKRDYYGENDHHPEWAIAIKFPPDEAQTEIIDIKWNFGKTGELTPIAIMKPVTLDGTTVRRATIHNIGWMIEKQCTIGAKVIIAKKGDIIPQIIKVVN